MGLLSPRLPGALGWCSVRAAGLPVGAGVVAAGAASAGVVAAFRIFFAFSNSVRWDS